MLNELNIVEEFAKIIKEETENYDLKAFLNEQCRYGQTVFTYYAETTALYDEYEADCNEWLGDFVEETGLYPWKMFKNWDYAVDSERNKWNVIVAMFENYCIYLLEGLSED